MGFKQVRTSDISGKELHDDEVINIVVRTHGKLSEPKQIDVAEAEIAPLKTTSGLAELEYRRPYGTSTTVFTTETELDNVVPLKVLQDADGIRGRRRGVWID
ncbi:hypothetical protein SAMN05421642_12329 [Rhodococcoides kyotonense]|uniref:Uncharacterized protein n=2 Tax=Rhodococcoides kyotonense TaxID=398843 RepID=A0A239MVJ0_9NOCA|nr:hypothetical protein SAMN05421642_12329 [Rhodococcus kyotonensis]